MGPTSDHRPAGHDPHLSRGVESDRDLLLGVAFRMLGARADAADAVQDAYSRWYALAAAEQAAIVSPTGWLVTVVSRICLDVLKSARVRRERYVGPWLPEPLPSSDPRSWSVGDGDPEQQVTLDESVTLAMLIVMETMTPAERVAFVLHDVFGYSFAEVAGIVGRTPGACRQLASAGRRKARTRPIDDDPSRHRATVAALRDAWRSRDVATLVGLLDPDVVAVVDGGGVVSAPTQPLEGDAAVAEMLLDVAARVPDLTLTDAVVNNRAGLIARDGGGTVLAVITVVASDSRVTAVFVTRNPAKLTAWT